MLALLVRQTPTPVQIIINRSTFSKPASHNHQHRNRCPRNPAELQVCGHQRQRLHAGEAISDLTTAPVLTPHLQNMFCQMMVGGNPFSIALPFNQCVVPQGINGPVAIWVTSDGQPLLNNVRDRATTQLVAGPTMAFIDTKPEMLEMVVRGGSGSVAGSAAQSVTTQTISPESAQSIVASVSATVGGAASATMGGAVSATMGGAASAATGSAAVAMPSMASGATVNAGASPAGAPGPNLMTGPSPDGAVTVNGWTNVTSPA